MYIYIHIYRDGCVCTYAVCVCVKCVFAYVYVYVYISPLWMWWGVTPYHMRGGVRTGSYVLMYVYAMQGVAIQCDGMAWHGMVGYGMHVFYVMDVILCYVLINIHTHTHIYIHVFVCKYVYVYVHVPIDRRFI